ncbi:hypothetical protein ACFU6R_11745 [Streptomyces sp. NPDC057499]|uniref:hypothetical protein n=1 Tax=Streptomyces sp. NPDC057499 TaxID=3346150 RepID=UPI00369A9589
MPDVNWEEAFCGEGNSCYRIGTDSHGNSYITISGEEDHYLTDTREALRQMILDIKAGKADHLL